MNIPVFTLLAVFILIAVRHLGRVRLQIWQIMCAGALFVLMMNEISLADALGSINVDVMIFLFAMFVIGHALEESGYLSHLSYEYFKRAKSIGSLLAMVIVGAAFASCGVRKEQTPDRTTGIGSGTRFLRINQQQHQEVL